MSTHEPLLIQNDNGISSVKLNIFATLKQGWQQISGTKAIITLGILVYLLSYLGYSIADKLLKLLPYYSVSGLVLSLFSLFLFSPLVFSYFMIGVKQAAKEPLQKKMLFRYFRWQTIKKISMLYLRWSLIFGWPLLVILGVEMIALKTGDLTTLLLFNVFYLLTLIQSFSLANPVYIIGYSVLLTLTCYYLYLFIMYYLAIPLMLEQQLSAGQALAKSRQLIKGNWFRLFGLCCIQLLLLLGAFALIFMIAAGFPFYFHAVHTMVLNVVIILLSIVIYLTVIFWFINNFGVVYQTLAKKHSSIR